MLRATLYSDTLKIVMLARPYYPQPRTYSVESLKVPYFGSFACNFIGAPPGCCTRTDVVVRQRHNPFIRRGTAAARASGWRSPGQRWPAGCLACSCVRCLQPRHGACGRCSHVRFRCADRLCGSGRRGPVQRSPTADSNPHRDADCFYADAVVRCGTSACANGAAYTVAVVWRFSWSACSWLRVCGAATRWGAYERPSCRGIVRCCIRSNRGARFRRHAWGCAGRCRQKSVRCRVCRVRKRCASCRRCASRPAGCRCSELVYACEVRARSSCVVERCADLLAVQHGACAVVPSCNAATCLNGACGVSGLVGCAGSAAGGCARHAVGGGGRCAARGCARCAGCGNGRCTRSAWRAGAWQGEGAV